MKKEELLAKIEEIKNLSSSEAWQKELILKSNYYLIHLICLYIKEIDIIDDVLKIVLTNKRVYEFLVVDEMEMRVRERFDVHLIEDERVSKIELLRRKNRK